MFKTVVLLLAVAGTPLMAAEATPFGAAPVTETALGAIAGKAGDPLQIIADNRSVVADNHIVGNVTTGGVSIDGNAFQSLNGLAIVNANTGNNVAINASLNVNVAISPR